MTYSRFKWSITGLFAVVAASAAMAPGSAQAQSPCYYYDTFSSEWVSYYSECEEAVQGATAAGQHLVNLGEGFVQQQLNLGVGGGLGAFATPTGRLRHTEHDGLVVKGTGGTRTGAFEVDEGSVFGSVNYDLPGTYFGGRVRVNGLIGYGRLQQDSEVPNGFSADIDSVIYGGSYLWSQGSFYSMSLIIGLSGDADARNAGASYSYDVSGYFTNSVMGYTFDLSSGWRFDVRGNLGHYDVSTDRFTVAGVTYKGVSEAWNVGLTGTLFTIVETGGGTLRPYIQAAYKNVFDEDIKLKGDFTAAFDQADDYGKVELGFDYVVGQFTYGAAGYTEFSSDESTFGARLGVSVKLQ